MTNRDESGEVISDEEDDFASSRTSPTFGANADGEKGARDEDNSMNNEVDEELIEEEFDNMVADEDDQRLNDGGDDGFNCTSWNPSLFLCN
jgi:hypothetical protein